MTERETEATVPTIRCPKCNARHRSDDSATACKRCRTVVSVVNFTPLLAAASLAPGEGRCQSHPSKDAIDACERCGGYLCDVCTTRTGEHLLCPTCFEWMHERGELETTISRRMRWDTLTATLLVGSLVCNLAWPLAMVTACMTLWKRRSERYLSVGSSVAVLLISMLSVLAIVLAVMADVD